MRQPKDMVEGMIHKTKNCGEIVIVKYYSAIKVLIRFIDTGYEVFSRSEHIRSGGIRDDFMPTALGVGFIGGTYYTSEKDKAAYQKWRSMIYRCYSDKKHKELPSYKNCEVCEEWQNFQIFADWYYENIPSDGSWCLDKDIMSIGGKLYSPENCIFVSNTVNVFLTDSAKARGKFLQGVTKRESGRFRSRVGNPFTGKYENIGHFATEAEAHKAWHKRKVEIAYEMIEKENLPSEVGSNLIKCVKMMLKV